MMPLIQKIIVLACLFYNGISIPGIQKIEVEGGIEKKFEELSTLVEWNDYSGFPRMQSSPNYCRAYSYVACLNYVKSSGHYCQYFTFSEDEDVQFLLKKAKKNNALDIQWYFLRDKAEYDLQEIEYPYVQLEDSDKEQEVESSWLNKVYLCTTKNDREKNEKKYIANEKMFSGKPTQRLKWSTKSLKGEWVLVNEE